MRSDPDRLDMCKGARGLRLRVVSLLAPVVLCTACGERNSAPDRMDTLAEIEQLAFVPAGRSPLSSSALAGARQISTDEALLVGMYEVTRGEFKRYVDSAQPELDPLLQQHIARWQPSDAGLPVSFVTRDEAAEFARWAGLRLLTSNEWLFCAISPRALAYPWADSWQQGRANTLDLGYFPYAPTQVGTFEAGRTETHLYDMLGNVWEWVSDDAGAGSPNAQGGTALGGSYLQYKREIHRDGNYFAQPLPPGARLEDLGFRVCAPARAWLESHAAELEREPDVHARLRAVGRRWGPSAVPLLGDLAAHSSSAGARAALEAILGGARQ